jgi:hypothetical protein
MHETGIETALPRLGGRLGGVKPVGGAQLIFNSHCDHQVCRQDEGRENVWTLSHRLTV